MASLKEIRARINSVTTTLKITDVTHMIAAAKLQKSQNVYAQYSRYCKKIDDIFTNYLSGVEMPDFPLTQVREVKKVAIIAISSNTSKCGAFNVNVIKETSAILNEYTHLGEDGVVLYAVGTKVYDAFKNTRKVNGPYRDEILAPSFENTLDLATELINKFINKEVDKVIIVNNRFRNLLTQVITRKTLLPFTAEKDLPVIFKKAKDAPKVEEPKVNVDYIVEPSAEELIKTLAPQLIKLNLYGKFLESLTSENAARSAAMQSATDNARELIKELTKEYNRQRQAAITNEILDIVGGAEALK